MKEFIDKLIERLEKEIQDVSESQRAYEVGSDMSITCSHIMGVLRDVKNRIIPKLAEEYKDKVMIDGQYCWQTCSATEHCKECNRLCNGSIDYYENYDFMADEYKGGWIPCSERLPELTEGTEYFKQSKCCLVALKWWDGDITESVGWYNQSGVWNEDSKNCKVIAWMPLPAPFKEGE